MSSTCSHMLDLSTMDRLPHLMRHLTWHPVRRHRRTTCQRPRMVCRRPKAALRSTLPSCIRRHHTRTPCHRLICHRRSHFHRPRAQHLYHYLAPRPPCTWPHTRQYPCTKSQCVVSLSCAVARMDTSMQHRFSRSPASKKRGAHGSSRKKS